MVKSRLKSSCLAGFAPPGPARRRCAGPAALLLLGALLLGVSAPAAAQYYATSIDAQNLLEEHLVDPAVELAGLLAADAAQWFDALAASRLSPEQTRELMVMAIEQDLASPNRWRIYHHMIEFGLPEDIPLLLERAETAALPLEKLALEGSARALYPAAYQGEDLSLVVEDFSFSQTSPPQLLKGRHTGKLLMSRDVFENYHREGLPIKVIKRLLPLRGRAYRSEERLGNAMRRSLNKKLWKAHRAKLLERLEPVPERIAQEGLLRFQLGNPLARPLMFKVAFNAWFARFDPPVPPKLVYLEPGTTKQIDLPVRVVKSQANSLVRVGMRMWEINGPFVPIFQKLYITF